MKKTVSGNFQLYYVLVNPLAGIEAVAPDVLRILPSVEYYRFAVLGKRQNPNDWFQSDTRICFLTDYKKGKSLELTIGNRRIDGSPSIVKFPRLVENIQWLNYFIFVFKLIGMLTLTGKRLTSLPWLVSELNCLEVIFIQNNNMSEIQRKLLSKPAIEHIGLSNSEEGLQIKNFIDYLYNSEKLNTLSKISQLKHLKNKADAQKTVNQLDYSELQKQHSFQCFIN